MTIKTEHKNELLEVLSIAKSNNYDYEMLAEKLQGHNYSNEFFDFTYNNLLGTFHNKEGKAQLSDNIDVWVTDNNNEYYINTTVQDILNT